MESRSGSIKDPIYYPENAENAPGEAAVAATSFSEADKSQRSSLGSQQEISLAEDGNALKVPRKFIANWRQACDRTRDRTKDLLKRWRTTASTVEELAGPPSVAVPELEQPSWSVHVWSEYFWMVLIDRQSSDSINLFDLLLSERSVSRKLSSLESRDIFSK